MKKSLNEIKSESWGLNVKPRQTYRYNKTGDLYRVDSVSHPTGHNKHWIVSYYKIQENEETQEPAEPKVNFWRILEEFEQEFALDLEYLYCLCFDIAKQGHLGQVDKAGKPYILHLLNVVNAVDSEEEKIVGVLHDYLEDAIGKREGQCRMTNLLSVLPTSLYSSIALLTKPKTESYKNYIERIRTSGDKVAIAVKIADLKDNMNLDRLSEVTEKDLVRNEKYAKALEKLESSLG